MGDFNLLPPERPLRPTAPEPAEPPTIFALRTQDHFQRQDDALRRSIQIALQTDPDFAAEAQRMGLDPSVTDPDAIKADFDSYRRIHNQRQLETWRLGGLNPVLRMQMQDARFAQVARDDIINLGKLERLGKSFRLGQAIVQQGRLETKRFLETLTPIEEAERLRVGKEIDELGEIGLGGPLETPFEFFGQGFEMAPGLLATGLSGGLGAAGAAAIPSAGVGVVPAFLTGFTTGVAIDVFRQSTVINAGHVFEEAYDDGKGLSFDDARRAAMIAGPIMGGLEVLGLGLFVKGGRVLARPIKDAFLRSVRGQTIAALQRPTLGQAGLDFAKGYLLMRVGGETGVEVGQDLTEIIVTDVMKAGAGLETEFGSAEGRARVAERLGETTATMVMGMSLISLPGPASSFLADVRRVQQSEADIATGEARLSALDATRLADRSVEHTESFTNSTLEGERGQTTYVDASRFTEAMAQTDFTLDDLDEALPGVSEQLEAAVRTGGDVVIPTAVYEARTKGTPFGMALRQHVRQDVEDSYSAAETPEVQEFQQGAQEQVQAEVEKSATFAESGFRVQQQAERELNATGRLAPVEAKAWGETFRATAETWAAALPDTTPEQVANEMVAGIIRGEEGTLSPEALRQRPRPDGFRGLSDTELVEAIDKAYGESVSQQTLDDLETELAHRVFEVDEAEEVTQRTAVGASVPEQETTGLGLEELLRQLAERYRADGLTAEEIGREIRSDGDLELLTQARVGEGISNAELGQEALDALAEHEQRVVGMRRRLERAEGRILRQGQGETLGAFDLPSRRIALFKGSNITSILHEHTHAYLEWLSRLAARAGEADLDPATRGVAMDANALVEEFLEWRGLEGGVQAWQAMSFEERKPHHEALAEEGERYFFTGKAPTAALKKVFDNLARWIAKLWKNFAGKREVDPRIRPFFDRMVASQEAIEHTESVRGLQGLFQEKPAEMSDADWTRHLEKRDASIARAIADIRKRSLGDLKWFRNLDAKTLRAMQREHDQLRGEMEARIREDVAAHPVYRALAFFHGGEWVTADGLVQEFDGVQKLRTDAVREILGTKRPPKPVLIRNMELQDAIAALGGLRRKDALEAGVDPAEINVRTNIAGVLRWVFPKQGLPLDVLREALEENGFDLADAGALTDALRDSRGGEHVFSQARELSAAEVREAAREEEELEASRSPSEAEAIEARPTPNLVKLRITSPQGMEPDTAAMMFDYPSGESLVRDMAEAQDIDELVAERTDARMAAENGDLVDADAVRRAVDDALHNPLRSRVLASEWRILSGATTPVRALVGAAREIAQDTLADMPISQIKAWRFQGAEARHARAAERARARGDTAAAMIAKRQELLQHEMAREAAKIEAEIEKAKKRWRKFDGKDEDIAKVRDIDLVNGGRHLLSAVDVLPAPTDQQVKQRREGMAEIAASFPAVHTSITGLIEDVSAIRPEPFVRGNRSFPVPIHRVLTLNQFRDVTDATDAIWALAKSSRLFEVEGRKVELQSVLDSLIEVVRGQAPRFAPGAQTQSNPTAAQRVVDRLWRFEASSKRFLHWAQFADLGGANGPFQRFILRPMLASLDDYRIQRNAIFERLEAGLRPLMKQYGARWDATISTGLPDGEGGIFKFRGVRQLLDVLLDIGNRSNLEKRLVAEGWAPDPRNTGGELDTRQWDKFFRDNLQTEQNPTGLITPKLMSYVSSIWAEFAELRPLAQETHKAIFGHEFKELELTDVELPWGTIPGGYAPLRVDWDRAGNLRAPENVLETAAGMEHDFQYSNGAVGTGRGFAMERNPNYHEKLSLDVSRRLQAFDEELRFIHLQPHVRAVLRLTRNQTKTVDGVEKVGFRNVMNGYDRHAITSIIEPWLDTTARQVLSRPGMHPVVDGLSRWLKEVTGIGILGLNLTVAVVQLTGLSLAGTQVQRRYVRQSIRSFIKNPPAAWREASEKSVRMLERMNTHVDKIREELQRQSSGPGVRTWRKFKADAGRFAWGPIRIMQGIVDVTVWHAAYQQSIAEAGAPAGMTDAQMAEVEKRAVQDADLAVERTQGGSTPESRAQFEGDTPSMQLLFQFMSFSNNLWNTVLVKMGLSPTIYGKMGQFLYVTMMISLWETAMRTPLEGLPEDEDDDGYLDELFGRLAVNSARNMVGIIPLAGGSIVSGFSGETDRIASAPAITMLRRSVEAFQSGGVMATGTMLTLATGLPIRPVAKSLDYVFDVQSGDVVPTSELDALRGFLTGRPSGASLR